MAFPALAVVLIIIVLLTIKSNQASKKGEDVEKNFWSAETAANQTRKQDIGKLDYIEIPLDKLPLSQSEDDVLKTCETLVTGLAGKKILNLTGISNTDLKLRYGAANLAALMEYDENFTQLARCLNNWGTRLAELDRTAEAATVYEFAVSCKTDITATYISLAHLYLKSGQPDKIRQLAAAASSLNSLSRKTILEKLNQLAV